MISLGTSSAYLQNQIISGFDSVAQGFTATATTSSSAGLQAALDSFSAFDSSQMTNLASMGSRQQISGAAEFSSPATYLKSQQLDSSLQADDQVLRAFQDPTLASGSDLSSISEILSQITSQADQRGIIIVSGSPTQLKQQTASKLEQSGLITPPQVGDSTKLEQVGVFAPPQLGGSTIPTESTVASQYETFDRLQQQGSTRLEQAGLMTPPQVGGSTKLEQAGLMTPPQFESPKLNFAGLVSPLQIDGSAGSTNLIPTEPHTPSLIPSDPHSPAEITFSPQQTTALASMSKTIRDAASLFQSVNVSMLGRRIGG